MAYIINKDAVAMAPNTMEPDTSQRATIRSSPAFQRDSGRSSVATVPSLSVESTRHPFSDEVHSTNQEDNPKSTLELSDERAPSPWHHLSVLGLEAADAAATMTSPPTNDMGMVEQMIPEAFAKDKGARPQATERRGSLVVSAPGASTTTVIDTARPTVVFSRASPITNKDNIFKKSSPYYQEFIDLVQRKGWTEKLPSARNDTDLSEFFAKTGFSRTQVARKFREHQKTFWWDQAAMIEKRKQLQQQLGRNPVPPHAPETGTTRQDSGTIMAPYLTLPPLDPTHGCQPHPQQDSLGVSFHSRRQPIEPTLRRPVTGTILKNANVSSLPTNTQGGRGRTVSFSRSVPSVFQGNQPSAFSHQRQGEFLVGPQASPNQASTYEQWYQERINYGNALATGNKNNLWTYSTPPAGSGILANDGNMATYDYDNNSISVMNGAVLQRMESSAWSVYGDIADPSPQESPAKSPSPSNKKKQSPPITKQPKRRKHQRRNSFVRRRGSLVIYDPATGQLIGPDEDWETPLSSSASSPNS